MSYLPLSWREDGEGTGAEEGVGGLGWALEGRLNGAGEVEGIGRNGMPEFQVLRGLDEHQMQWTRRDTEFRETQPPGSSGILGAARRPDD